MLSVRTWLKKYDRLRCPYCKKIMTLIGIEPEEPEFMLRKFECQQCSYLESDIAKVK